MKYNDFIQWSSGWPKMISMYLFFQLHTNGISLLEENCISPEQISERGELIESPFPESPESQFCLPLCPRHCRIKIWARFKWDVSETSKLVQSVIYKFANLLLYLISDETYVIQTVLPTFFFWFLLFLCGFWVISGVDLPLKSFQLTLIVLNKNECYIWLNFQLLPLID